MNLVKPYRGTYVSAEDASKDLDVQAVISACSEIDEQSFDIVSRANEFQSNGSGLTEEVLSVEGKTFLKTIEECSNKMKNAKEYVNNTTSKIIEETVNAYNRLQEDYNRIAEYNDKQEIYRRQSTSAGE